MKDAKQNRYEKDVEMLIDDPQFLRSLKNLVRHFSVSEQIYKDLMQEALIHVWQTEERTPNQKPAWYRTSCWFLLKNRLRQSNGERSAPHPVRHSFTEEDEIVEPRPTECDTSFMSILAANELVRLLSDRLSGTYLLVFNHFVMGWGINEIAIAHHLSHQHVTKIRLRIAAEASALGFSPTPTLKPKHFTKIFGATRPARRFIPVETIDVAGKENRPRNFTEANGPRPKASARNGGASMVRFPAQPKTLDVACAFLQESSSTADGAGRTDSRA
jgi:DNA-directed RNA polymerase specialized sigma24 family protein